MNKKDTFNEQLKSIFSDFEAPVPPDGWEKIEQSLNAAARVRIIRRNRYIASAAAVVAIVFGGLFFLKTPRPGEQNRPVYAGAALPGKAEQQVEMQRVPQTTEPPGEVDKNKIEAVPRVKRERPLLAGHLQRERPPEEVKAEVYDAPPAENMGTTALVTGKEHTREESSSQMNPEEVDRLVREFENAGNSDIFNQTDREEKKNRPIMLALNAKGGLKPSQKTVNSPMTLRSAVADKSNDLKDYASRNNLQAGYENAVFAAGNIADNIAEMEHAQPLSLGITVSKTFAEGLSVETGLVYTYLFSRARNTGIDFRNQETQRFHYVGIPVNVNYNLLKLGKLDIFASMGAMLEKDIYGEFRSSGQSVSSELNSSSQGTIVSKIRQRNPQLSVNAALGIAHPIYGGFGLYGKIGGSYYFDAKNYEHKTIYSDKKIMLDLNVGIRFDF